MKPKKVLNLVVLVVSVFIAFSVFAESVFATITINPDKTISIDGKKTFPVTMASICNPAMPPCDVSHSKDFNGELYGHSFGSIWSAGTPNPDILAQYESNKMFFTLHYSTADSPSRWQQYFDSSSFFAFHQDDETTESISSLKSKYQKIKNLNPNYLVFFNHYLNFNTYSQPGITDVLSWDTYAIANEELTQDCTDPYWDRIHAMYVYERKVDASWFKGIDINSVDIPVWAVLQGHEFDCLVFPTQAEVRANTYIAITMDVKGISYYGYKPVPPSRGLVYNETLYSYYKQLARELRSLNDILVMPTKEYSWQFCRPGAWKYCKTGIVSLDKNLTANVRCISTTFTNFNYILKQNSTATYLIVVNKDSRPISNVGITISGLTGAMTAKTLGLETTGSSRAGRTLTVTNGKFTDSFDGYAAHIYEISSGAPTCVNDCSPSGAKQCTSDGLSLKTCGNYDADSCLEWKTETCPRMEIGNYDYGTYTQAIPFQNDPRLTWDVYASTSNLGKKRSGVTSVFQQYWPGPDQFKGLTDLNQLDERFNLAVSYKDKYDYGIFLLEEEVYHPCKMVSWGYSNLGEWYIEGSRTFAGVTVKLLKDWYIEKYGSWSQSWWDGVKATKNCDSITRDWSRDYAYGLYQAWKNHMDSLYKKTAIVGLVGVNDFQANNDVSAILNSYYPSPIKNYILQNYDLVFVYHYPTNIEHFVAWEEDFVKKLREIYTGKIAVILTSAFSSVEEGNWNWDEAVAFDEFKRDYPYVDVIMTYPYADVRDWNNPQIPYPPKLINFWESYKPCQSGNCISTSGVIPTPPTCTLNSVSIAPQCSGGSSACKTGEKIKVDVYYSGDCPSTSYIQIDAKSSDGACDIQGSGGDMLGIQTTCTSGTCTGYWTIPAVAPDCLGKTVSAYAAGIWNGGFPGTGAWVAGKSGSFGSFSFAGSVFADTSPPAAGHPNTYLNQAEINVIKAKVMANQEPWKTAYDGPSNSRSLMAEANAALSETRPPRVTDGTCTVSSFLYKGETVTGSVYDFCDITGDRIDYSSAIKLGRDVRALGLAYAFTGDTRYADKALEYIHVWTIDPATKMNPRFTNGQSYISLSITLPGMFYGADLIWNYPGWSSTEKEKFKSWTAQILEDAKNGWEEDWSHDSNFENWRLVFISSAPVVTEDAASRTYAFNRWKELISSQMDTEGKMVKELTHPSGNYLGYSLYAINAMIQTAEIARHYGVDLYNYKLSDGRGLELALDFHAPYVINPSTWPYGQTDPLDAKITAAHYELAYLFKQKSSYINAINKWGRPLYEIRTMGPVTLTHAFGAYTFTLVMPSPPPSTCSDGTLYGQCSSNKPKYCDNGNLVNKCGSPQNCGCPSGQTCQSGTCAQICPIGKKLSVTITNQKPTSCTSDVIFKDNGVEITICRVSSLTLAPDSSSAIECKDLSSSIGIHNIEVTWCGESTIFTHTI